MPQPASKKRSDILHAPVGKTLREMTIPMMFGIISVIVFNLADIAFIGRLGSDELAAVAFTFPVVFAVTSLAIGLSVGTSATLGHQIGQGANPRSAGIARDILLLSLISVVLVTSIMLVIKDPIFRLMGAHERLLPYIDQYMSIWFAGAVFMVLNIVCNGIFRAWGLMRLSVVVMIVSALINLILDPILIFGLAGIPAYGVAGAAMASFIAWSLATLAGLVLLYRRKLLTGFSGFNLAQTLAFWARLLTISLPAAFSNLMTPVANGILTAIVASHGPQAVAAFGVGNRIESLALLVSVALSMTLPPFISQNFGAGSLQRVATAYRKATRFALLWQMGVFLLICLLAQLFSRLFTEDQQVGQWLYLWLVIVPGGFGFQAITFLTSSSFNALHKPAGALRISLVRLFVMYVPLAWLGSVLFGLVGMFAALVLANA